MGTYMDVSINKNRTNMRIKLKKMHQRLGYDELLTNINSAKDFHKLRRVLIDFSNIKSGFYPNIILPISAMGEFFKDEKHFDVDLINIKHPYLKRASIIKPIIATKENINSKGSIFDVVWKFNNKDHSSNLLKRIVNEVSMTIKCSHGVINGMSWSISEIMDNVIQHSGVGCGYFMIQNHPKNNHLCISIYDNGVGFFKTLVKTKYNPKNDKHAIELATTKNVTRDKNIGQGFGLWGLKEIINLNKGILQIASRSSVFIQKNGENKYKKYFENRKYLSKQFGSVLIDFQIDYDTKIDLSDIFGVTGHGERFYAEFEKYETIEGYINFPVIDFDNGTGTRVSGNELRIKLYNHYIDTDKFIVIDFKGITYITSSFSDEFIGKLIKELGEDEFIRRFTIANLPDEFKDIMSFSIDGRTA